MRQERFASTLVIAAAIIAVVRLAREPDVSKPSPRVVSAVADAVSLARMILDKITRCLKTHLALKMTNLRWARKPRAI
jgi:hypothetical protein